MEIKTRKTRSPIQYNYKIESEDEFPYHITEDSDNTLADQLKFLCMPNYKVFGNGIFMAYGCGDQINYTGVRWKKKFETGRKRQLYEIVFLNGDVEIYTAKQFYSRFIDTTIKVGVVGEDSELRTVYYIDEIRALREIRTKKETKKELP